MLAFLNRATGMASAGGLWACIFNARKAPHQPDGAPMFERLSGEITDSLRWSAA